MKKVLALVLAAVLVMSMAVPAAADSIFSASVRKSLPALAKESEKNVKLHNLDDVMKLPEEIQDLMAEAEEKLKDYIPKGLAVRYFFYAEVLSDENAVSVDFEHIPYKESAIMQYIDGMWVTLEHAAVDGSIITVPVVAEAPVVILTEPLISPGASWEKLVPVLTDESHLSVQLHTLEEVAIMSEEIQNQMAEAKDKLKDACPAGFAVKYFFALEILGAEGSVFVDFEPIEHDEIMFMQYVDGAWVELEYTMNGEGILTVSGVMEAPVSVFTFMK